MTRIKFLLIFFVASRILLGQNDSQTDVYVDKSGIMRWKGSDKEVALFGVNYTTPFAYSYRAHKKLGVSLKSAIDLDIQQMVRLGFNAFRVHVWDREISDRDGNLLLNEHLNLFDYLISELAKRNIKTIITPIAWWGTGWPEPDGDAPGFSQLYPKLQLVTNQNARAAQRNYVKQFMDHVNPYTKKSYKNEPSIIAMEIINEPFHPENTKEVTEYINEMVKVIRDNGYKKPVFYNISENWNDEQAQAVLDADVQGITFQWYPTGLVHNKSLEGHYLLNVNKYQIPAANLKGFKNKSKMVYEFDAADIPGTFMYPAMARSFRETGMQFATMFSYDPVQIAWSNTEYPTHFANLLYTPSKAIGLLLASKVFQLLPREKSYGDFPENNRFGDFRISYEDDHCELNNDSLFIYTNTTLSAPKNTKTLKQVAGVGSSPVVNYDGTGAYFLDKIDNGTWRLEINPDVLWLHDPFQSVSIDKQSARLFWNERRMEIKLPDLGSKFGVVSLTDNELKVEARNNSFTIKPGIYLLSSLNQETRRIKAELTTAGFYPGLYQPRDNSDQVYVVNKSTDYMAVNEPVKFWFEIASDKKISNASLFVKKSGWRGFAKFPLTQKNGFIFKLDDSLKTLEEGLWEYCVEIETDKGAITFPGGIEKSPEAWDFYSGDLWKVSVLPAGIPFAVLDVNRDKKDFVLPSFTKTMKYKADYKSGTSNRFESISLNISYDQKNEIPFALQHSVSGLIGQLGSSVNLYSRFVIRGRGFDSGGTDLIIGLLTVDGKSFRSRIKLSNEWTDIEIPIEQFDKGDLLIMPFSYPKFLPKFWPGTNRPGEKVLLKDLNFIQLIAPGTTVNNETGFEIESIILK